jgi:hypothetical protein
VGALFEDVLTLAAAGAAEGVCHNFCTLMAHGKQQNLKAQSSE